MKDKYQEPECLSKIGYYCKVQKAIHRNLFRYVTRHLLKTNISPNQITIMWILFQTAGALLMVFGIYKYSVIGLILYTIATLLDHVDGQIARIKKQYSYKGVFLEELGLYFGSPMFFLCFSIGIFRASGEPLYFIMGLVSSFCFLYAKLAKVNPAEYGEAMRDKILSVKGKLTMRRKKNCIFSWVHLLTRRSQPLNLLFFGIIFKFPKTTLLIYTALFILELARRLLTQISMLYKLDKAKH
tara:strand:+ start:25446 stop:26168 length:723 start_codon:yes stop_codon:yes gene_type:complete